MIGETIGHFKIVSLLGRGGMGEVYAGEHEGIQTRVAIKMLLPEISRDEAHVRRFFNEAKIVSKIRHAGIVKIFDVGNFQGHAYLVMEMLEGEPLSARIERGRLDWHDAAELGRQTASVLDATHRAGIIHRDLKPDNIFLVPDHELARGERVKVLDFGISKLSGTMSANSPKTVGTMGTPAYMAPEQWGNSAEVDWRADAYSLGCVLFEMACGRPPFVCNTIAEACGKHMHAKPPVPSSLAPGLPPELDALVLRLLAKEPADRAVSMGQVARELEAIATGRDLASIPERRPASQPSVAVEASPSLPPGAVVTPPLQTTLGASAAELAVTARRKRPALIGGLVAGAVVIAVVIIAVTQGGSKDVSSSGSAAEPASSAMPSSAATAAGSAAPSAAATNAAIGAAAGSATTNAATTTTNPTTNAATTNAATTNAATTNAATTNAATTNTATTNTATTSTTTTNAAATNAATTATTTDASKTAPNITTSTKTAKTTTKAGADHATTGGSKTTAATKTTTKTKTTATTTTHDATVAKHPPDGPGSAATPPPPPPPPPPNNGSNLGGRI